MTQRSVVFLAAYDSQLKWCARLRDAFAARGFRSRVVVPPGRSALSAQQIADAGFDQVEFIESDDLVEVAAACDVLVTALAGPATRSLITELSIRLGDRTGPVIISGWVGVIIEKITAGYLDRCGADVIAVNSVGDLDHFRAAADCLSLPVDNLLLAGLPLLSGDPAPSRPGINTVLFADQPTVPSTELERRYIYQRLIDYAVAHPDRRVVLKPRHRPDESTFHRMRHHPERLLAEVARPDNFTIDYTPISEVLPDTDLLLTMSSTAALEAIEHGSRVGLVLDLGVHERYGNQVFLRSGLLRTFAQLTRDEIGRPQPDWLAEYFFARSASPAELIVERTEDLLASGQRPSRTVWASEYFAAAREWHVTRRDTAVTVLRSWRHDQRQRLARLLPRQARRLARRALGGRRGGQGRAEDLRLLR